MPQFMNETDMSLTRMGSEIMFQSQVIEAQKKQIAELITAKEAIEKHAKQLELQIEKAKSNGHERERQDAPEEQRRSESESVSRQRGNMDNRRRTHSNGGAAEAAKGNDTQ